MKKILFIIIGLFLCSCELVYEDIEIGELYFYDFKNDIQVESLEEAVDYVFFEIKYKSDIKSGSVDYWQTPEKTYNLKTGDCEDQANLLIYLLQTKLNYNSFLLISHSTKKGACHATVFSNDLFLDPTNGTIKKQLDKEWIVVDIIPYAEAIWMAVAKHKYILN